MTCRAIRLTMGKVLAGCATEDEQTELNCHVRGCARCAGHWQTMTATAARLRAAAPPALETRGLPLVVPAAPRAVALARRRYLPAAVALSALLLLASVLGLHRPRGGQQSLLEAVEAALAQRPWHYVQTFRGADGRVTLRAETWRTPEDDTYVEALMQDPELLAVNGLSKPATFPEWRRPRQNTMWLYLPGKQEYVLTWKQGALPGGPDPAPGFLEPGDPADVLRWLRRAPGEVAMAEKTASLDGRETKLITITSTWKGVDGKLWSSNTDSYLDPSSGRLLRQISRSPGVREMVTHDFYPIDYEPVPLPSGAELRLTPGTKVRFEETRVEPVWEWLPESEKQQVRETVAALGAAWHSGDFAAFSRYYDFAAGTRYGVAGRWTAGELEGLWRRLVEQQPARWRQDALVVDYAVQTGRPPAFALDYWSIARTRGKQAPVQVYGVTPSREPGLLVLARERVIDRAGKERELRTRLFLKKIGGQYKVILWRPPFA